MNIEMSPWVPAVLIELGLAGFGLAAWFRYRAKRMQDTFRESLDALRQEVEDARAEARRIEQEALRKRKIITFEETDLQDLVEAGDMAGDAETMEKLKTRISESAEVMSSMTAAATEIGGKLSEVMEKQMEAVNMVGRLGGTGGLPPEVKEKAEAILDVFRAMDELLSGAYEGMDKLESGLGEVASVITEYTEADPTVKLPSVDALNAALKKKSGGGETPPAGGADAAPSEPSLDAFDDREEVRA
jgi:hypothetical protein